MNKILPYIVIAIMLGTVTMIVPLMLLKPSDTTVPEESTLIQTEQPETPAPEPTEPEPEQLEPETSEPVPSEPESFGPVAGNDKTESTERSPMEEEGMFSADAQAPVPSTPSEPESVPEPEQAVPLEPAPETLEPDAETLEPEPPEPAISEVNLITEALSNLSSIGLIIIPSFLIALGVFVYLKRRMS